MAIKVWDGSSWQMASQIKVWDGNTWQNNEEANVRIWTGSSWQLIHPGVLLDPLYTQITTDYSPSFPNAESRLTLFANGTLQIAGSDSVTGTNIILNDTWLISSLNTDYDVYVLNFAGDALNFGSSPTDGTRLNLGTDHQWSILSSNEGVKSATFDIVICSNTGGGTIIQTSLVTIQADASSGP